MTRYEKEIYGIVSNSYEHLTAEKIFEELKKKESRRRQGNGL